MSALRCTSFKTALSVRESCSKPVPACAGRKCVVTTASMRDEASVSRREALGFVAASVSASALLVASPAQAFLGIGESGQLEAAYAKETESVLGKVRGVLAAGRDDPAKDELITDLRKDINSWVAKYRREPKVSGKPSYGNTYSALNALAGHFNSFGTNAPVPKKRLERLTKELNDATLYLSRNR